MVRKISFQFYVKKQKRVATTFHQELVIKRTKSSIHQVLQFIVPWDKWSFVSKEGACIFLFFTTTFSTDRGFDKNKIVVQILQLVINGRFHSLCYICQRTL